MADYVIVHWEGLRLNIDLFASRAWNTVIADEVHRAANRATKQTRALKRLVAVRKIGLSATPIHSQPDDLWSVLNWLDSKKFSSYWHFCNKYVSYKINWAGFREAAGINPNERQTFSRVVGPYILRRTKAQVLPDLPPRIDTVVPVEMTDEQSALYQRVKSEPFVGEKYIPNYLARLVRLLQVSSSPKLLDFDIESGKLHWIYDWLSDNPEVPVVIMSHFRGVAIDLAKKYGGACCVGGGKAAEEAERFVRGDCRLLVGTIAAAGESLNLQRADVLIFADQVWSTRLMIQATDRIHRVGIKSSKQIYYLLSKGTVDEVVYSAFKHNWSEAELILRLAKEWRSK